MLDMVDLHDKCAFRKSKIFTTFISSAAEVSPYTNFGRGVV